jgi:hypothetical protein
MSRLRALIENDHSLIFSSQPAWGFKAMLIQMRAGFTEAIREGPGDAPADVMAATLVSVVPGYILQLALLGPEAVDGVPEALRSFWPS